MLTMAMPMRQAAICNSTRLAAVVAAPKVIHPVLEVHRGCWSHQPSGMLYFAERMSRKPLSLGHSAQ